MIRSLIFGSVIFCLACSGEDDSGHMHGHNHHGGMGHSTPDEADTYVAGLEKVGTSGDLTVRLMDSTPSPRDTGIYTWHIMVLDAEGQPVSDATVQAEPLMPAHGHGTNPRYTDATGLDEDGMYELKDMDLFMEGIWNVIIRISTPDGTADEVEYNFFLEG